MSQLYSSTGRFTFVLAIIIVMASTQGCSKKEEVINNPAAGPATPTAPQITGAPVSENLKNGESAIVNIDNGTQIVVQKTHNKFFHLVEATFTNEAIKKALMTSASLNPIAKRESLNKAIQLTFNELKEAGAIPMNSIEDAAYFSFLLPYEPMDVMGRAKKITLTYATLINPVVQNFDAMKQIRQMNPLSEGFVLKRDPRLSSEAYSGLARINALQFSKRAARDIGTGEVVNGANVKLGVTDTGITYNHLTFRSSLDRSKNRIQYMKDFTREGRVYFSISKKTEIKENAASADEILITAETITTPRLPSMPYADQFTTIVDLPIKVTAEQKNLILTSSDSVKVGILREEIFGAEGEPVDLNNNGKVNDQLSVILIMGSDPSKDIILFDSIGNADFRSSPLLGDFNSTKKTQRIFAEQIAFDIKKDTLPTSDGLFKLEVRSVSIVGFDPGNHGSHVAGIAAGSKTIANDDFDTLARGVAPEAEIFMNRVCANNGGCSATEAIVDIAVNGKVDVVNMSLGGLSAFNDGTGVQEAIINRLTSTHNVLFVISAGNSGPGRQTIGSPSVARLSLSVGAAATQAMIQRQYQWPGGGATDATDLNSDFLLFFSSRGPTAAGGFKPNVTAPGTELSAIQLNTAPGQKGGLDVYWGTSMSAPTAAGAYALLLDGVRKFNSAHPDSLMPTDSITLRRVLIESARPFDVTRFDTETGTKSKGQYTWIDQGTGMIDLNSAWELLMRNRLMEPASPIKDSTGKDVVLDYEIYVSSKMLPNGNSYDGTRPSNTSIPNFASGLYLDTKSDQSLYAVNIGRRLPAKYSASPDNKENTGELTSLLRQTKDDFVLKTVMYGSDVQWIKAGSRDELNCWDSETSDLQILSEGALIDKKEDGSSTITSLGQGVLNVCINRELVKKLSPGDHGALISAYRTDNGRAGVVPAFIVPVYINVPHQTLGNSTAYEVQSSVKSFGVDRNYIQIPEGTSLVKVSLEVPELKAGESCSGVELMALIGSNTSKAFASRPQARALNCDAVGSTAGVVRMIKFEKTNPTPGIWDLHVFGLYKYKISNYKLRVDYITGTSDKTEISGPLSALNGNINFIVKESTLNATPDATKSKITLTGVFAKTDSLVAKGKAVVVPDALGNKMRSFDSNTKEVVITTGGSPGNDIDLLILECADTAKDEEDSSCIRVAASGGATDDETASFIPKTNKKYVVHVDGYEISNEGRFFATETIRNGEEAGTLLVKSISANTHEVTFAFSADQLTKSPLINSGPYATGKYKVVGTLVLKSTENLPLISIPIKMDAKTVDPLIEEPNLDFD